MKTDRDVLGWAAMLASIAVTAHGEWSLAVSCGYAASVAIGLPIAIDAYAIRAMRAGREIFPPVLLMVATNAGAHLVHGGMMTVQPWLIVLVSAIAPVVLWRVHALRRYENSVPAPAPAEYAEAPTVERVPDPYPAIESPVPAVPEAVPPGVRLLPAFECPGELNRALSVDTWRKVVDDEEPRTRDEVHAEYAPEPLDEPVPETREDPLTAAGIGLAAEQFKAELYAGDVPSIRTIKTRLRVGQSRAEELQHEFRRAVEQLAVQGATS